MFTHQNYDPRKSPENNVKHSIMCDAHMKFKNFNRDIEFVVATNKSSQSFELTRIKPAKSNSLDWLSSDQKWTLREYGYFESGGLSVKGIPKNNNLYRVKTKFSKVEENLFKVSMNGGLVNQESGFIKVNKDSYEGFERWVNLLVEYPEKKYQKILKQTNYIFTNNEFIASFNKELSFAYNLRLGDVGYLIFSSVFTECDWYSKWIMNEKSLGNYNKDLDGYKGITQNFEKLPYFVWLKKEDDFLRWHRHGKYRDYTTTGGCHMDFN